MTNFTSALNDKILHFLYSNVAFQQLEEAQQYAFIERFGLDKKFQEIVEVALSMQESIQEVEATMPKILERDRLFLKTEQHELLKANMVVKGNVYHVPFAKKQTNFSPFIVCVQCSQSMKQYETYYKGLLLPLFNLCARQQRDLIIIPFNDQQHEPILYTHGQFTLDSFDLLFSMQQKGEATIVPAIEQALALLAGDEIQHVPEVMFVTDNQFTDFEAVIQADYETAFLDVDAEVSVIAMSEIDFEIQPIPFANKVFYVGE
ncbi:MAG: hypothetical protein ABS951_14070 [Solibacillus sp.]